MADVPNSTVQDTTPNGQQPVVPPTEDDSATDTDQNGEETVTMLDVLQEQEDLENDADAGKSRSLFGPLRSSV